MKKLKEICNNNEKQIKELWYLTMIFGGYFMVFLSGYIVGGGFDDVQNVIDNIQNKLRELM